jgi:pimeloyl-ACP methyl ester carboxylesterase
MTTTAAVEPTRVIRRKIHGYQRAYRLAGEPRSGTTILLLHGIGDSSESWVPLIPELARHHRVLAPDLLGHGGSDKPRADYSAAAFANGIRDLLDVLDIDRVTIVGHSLGGGISAQFAYQYPDRVERLVLVAAGGVGRDVSPFLRFATLPFSELGVPLLHTPPGRLLTSAAMSLLKLTRHNLAIDADELGRVLRSLPEDGAFDAFTRTLRSVVDWRGQVVTLKDRAYLAEHIPMAVMWGRKDAVIPVEHAEQLRLALPHAVVSIYDEAGHFPHHSDPERFLSELLDFIASTEPSVFDAEAFKAQLREETRSDQMKVTAA